MKLYYSAGACSLTPHIVLEELGVEYQAISAPTKTHKLPDGSDYYLINPLGYVPLLVLDDGRQLREGPAINQYLADLAPEKNLAPANGSFERYKLQETLNFISTEIHKNFSPLFSPATPADYKASIIAKLGQRLTFTDGELAGKTYLMGEHFTIADAYLFNVTNWAGLVGVDISGYSNLLAFRARVAARPAVIAAMKAEGLIK
jgi:glutathione S-transferase